MDTYLASDILKNKRVQKRNCGLSRRIDKGKQPSLKRNRKGLNSTYLSFRNLGPILLDSFCTCHHYLLHHQTHPCHRSHLRNRQNLNLSSRTLPFHRPFPHLYPGMLNRRCYQDPRGIEILVFQFSCKLSCRRGPKGFRFCRG